MSLQITITPETNNRKRIAIGGSLDSNTSPELQLCVDTEINDSVQDIIIDFNHLDFISSAGLRIIFKAKKMLEAQSGKLYLVNLKPQIKKVFEIIRALDGMNVFRSQDEMDDYLTVMQNKVIDGE